MRCSSWVVVGAILTALLVSACSAEIQDEPLRFPEPLPAAQASPPPTIEPTTPRQVQAAIYRWFLKAGYPAFQAAALVDHARLESGLNPCIGGPGGLRYTYQWGGTRLQRLYRFAGTQSCPPLNKQLAFADDELRHDAKFSCFLGTTTREGALAALRRGFGRGSC